MKPLKYYVATSVDGFIAQADGSFGGFATEGDSIADYIDSLSQFDTVLMGRKTYDVGLKEGKTNPYPMLKSYVFSRTMATSPDPQVTLVSDQASQVVKQLKAELGSAIYLCGGATLAAQLFTEGLIDELILKINPFVMGQGIPLFATVIPQTQLTLIGSQIYANGVAWLRYEV
ncbi:MAG TPA: dihydrofolate reductase family protein [Candidatus Obscuribacterales bacterium]